MIRWIPVLLLVFGCATPRIHPSQIQVKEIEFGVYAHVNGEDVLIETTDEIPCRSDAMFGVRLRLSWPGDDSVRLPIRLELREPVIPGKRSGSQIKPDEDMLMPKGINSFVLAMTDEFEGDFELVDGQYEVRLIEPETGLAYYSRKFFLRDCEGTSPHNKILHQTNIRRASD